MLDLEALIAEMHGLADQVARSAREVLEQRDAAAAQVSRAGAMEGLRKAALEFGEDMAVPVEGRDMSRTYPPPPAEGYTVLATDGSQVPPDYHHVAPWYVVNTGCAVFRYDPPSGRERCRLSSRPALLPPARPAADSGTEEDETADARGAAVGFAGQIEVERLVAELRAALDAVVEEADPGRSVLLLDGPLVQWRMIHLIRQPEAQARVVQEFHALLRACFERQVPIAGYISRSRAVAWVTLLRFSLCPGIAAEGKLCPECRATFMKAGKEPPPEAHHAALARVRDTQVAEALLPGPGWRTEVIGLRSGVWDRIGGGDREAGFFYLHTGREIARLEVPHWVWSDPARMELLHAALWDQCESGAGYPMVLAEAHEQAVVRAADRDAFFSVIERVLTDHQVYDTSTSAKAAAKRRPLA